MGLLSGTIRGIKRFFNIFKVGFTWGEDTINKHPKIAKFYDKGLLYRWILWLVGLLITAIGVGATVAFYYGIFNGEWGVFIPVGIVIVVCFILQVKFTSTFCYLGLNRFMAATKKSVDAKIKKYKDKKAKQNASKQTEENKVDTIEELQAQALQIALKDTQPTQTDQPTQKTHRVFDMFCFITCGLFSFILPFAQFVIPFTASMWL